MALKIYIMVNCLVVIVHLNKLIHKLIEVVTMRQVEGRHSLKSWKTKGFFRDATLPT